MEEFDYVTLDSDETVTVGTGVTFYFLIDVIKAVCDTYSATNGGLQYSSDLTFGRDKLEVVFNITIHNLLTPELDLTIR